MKCLSAVVYYAKEIQNITVIFLSTCRKSKMERQHLSEITSWVVVSTHLSMWLWTLRFSRIRVLNMVAPWKSKGLGFVIYGQKVGKRSYFTHFCLFSMGMMCYLSGECASGLKCWRLASTVRAVQSAQDARRHKPVMTKKNGPEPFLSSEEER